MFRKAVSTLLGGRAKAGESDASAAPPTKTKPGSPTHQASRLPSPVPAVESSAQSAHPPKPAKLPPRPPAPAPTAVAPPSSSADDSVSFYPEGGEETTQQKSVKITFPKGVHDRSVLTEEQVKVAASRFGEVCHVMMSDRNCMILFSRSAEAMNCCASLDTFQGLLPSLGYPTTRLKIKYMGNSMSNLDDSFVSTQSLDLSVQQHQQQDSSLRPQRDLQGGGVAFLRELAPLDSSLDQTKIVDLENEGDVDDLNASIQDRETGKTGALNGTESGNNGQISRSASNLSLQSELASVSTSGQAFNALDQDDDEEGDAASSRDSWKWKNANSAISGKQVPHFAQQKFLPHSLNESAIMGEELELENTILKRSPSQPPIALTRKTSREIHVGSPNAVKPMLVAELQHTPHEMEGLIASVTTPTSQANDNPLDEIKSTASEEDDGSTTKPNDESFLQPLSRSLQTIQHQQEERAVPYDAAVSLQPEEDVDHWKRKYSEASGRLRIIEAETKLHYRERVEFVKEFQVCEETWSRELTEISIRNTHLEAELHSLKETNRKAKIELSRMSAELAAANAAKDSAEAVLDGYSAKAERDSLSTVLAHQRLIAILEKQKDDVTNSAKRYKEEVLHLRELHKQSVAEGLAWKAKAENAAAETKACDNESKNELGKVDNDIYDIVDDEAAAEQSTRATVKQELAKYLKLLNSTDAAALAVIQEPMFIIEEKNTKQNFLLAEARARSTSEKIAADLLDSRRKLEAVRSRGWG